MELTELTAALKQHVIHQREIESELLDSIAKMTNYETAEAAKDIYTEEKHTYTFDGYLNQLYKLQTVLAAGVPSDIALEAVDSCLDEQTIISAYRLSQGGGI